MKHTPEANRFPCYVEGCKSRKAIPFMGNPEPGLPTPGQLVCDTHWPKRCWACGCSIPWFDGSTCDYCDRYMDEGG